MVCLECGVAMSLSAWKCWLLAVASKSASLSNLPGVRSFPVAVRSPLQPHPNRLAIPSLFAACESQ